MSPLADTVALQSWHRNTHKTQIAWVVWSVCVARVGLQPLRLIHVAFVRLPVEMENHLTASQPDRSTSNPTASSVPHRQQNEPVALFVQVVAALHISHRFALTTAQVLCTCAWLISTSNQAQSLDEYVLGDKSNGARPKTHCSRCCPACKVLSLRPCAERKPSSQSANQQENPSSKYAHPAKSGNASLVARG
jgi:hypothetical protein